MIKKIFFLFIITLILVSCSTTGNQNTGDLLKKMGKDGDILICGDSSFLDSSLESKVDRYSIVFADNSVNGTIDGKFNSLEAKIAFNEIDLDLNYYQPFSNSLIFSSDDAKSYYLNLLSSDNYLPDFEASVMSESEFALYSVNPSSYPNLEKIFIVVDKDCWRAEMLAKNNESAKGLFTSVKTSYVSHLNVNGIKVDFKELANHFSLKDNIVLISDMSKDDNYIKKLIKEFLNYGN